ncbi:Flp family type IVb pilin [Vibrio sp. JPW-9-11-11]|uniref:Flp family type IVb pilin n=1 Tax=Vibrio sp. JPW-9-11-11 TaxID=1416532 RepID=UPI0015935A21|nr:Flp family type IVb pilin [Vibrio sp. JPW-9-11-11]NVD07819.1 Flp family type IVb pilin [Vibrio sp. JPW-9-11-11]
MYYKTLAKLAGLKRKFKDDIRGVTAVEYAIIAVVMATAVLGAFNSAGFEKTFTDALGVVTEKMAPPSGEATGEEG